MHKEYFEMTSEEKKLNLFLRQKRTLDLFLERNAISKAQYDKSLGELTEKMGIMMTYKDFRDSFDTVEDFKRAFGNLSEEEAHALIASATAPTHITACMFTTWKEAKKEYENKQD